MTLYDEEIMKKRIVTAIICTMMMLSACGAEKTEANSSMFESTGTETFNARDYLTTD